MRHSIFPFCVLVGEPSSLKEEENIMGLPLKLIKHGEVSMLILKGGFPNAENGFDQKLMIIAALKHGKVINSLFKKYTLIPFRFNTGFKSETEAHNWIINHYESILAELHFLKNKFEIRLWIKEFMNTESTVAKKEDDTKKSPGANYMLNKMAKYKNENVIAEKTNLLATQLKEMIGQEYCLNFRHSNQTKKNELVDIKIDFLLTDVKKPSIENKVKKLLKAENFSSYEVTGPWPVFHFVSDTFIKSLQQ